MADRHRLTIRDIGGEAASASAETIRLGVARARGLAASMVGVHVAGRRGAAMRTSSSEETRQAGAPPDAGTESG